MKNKNVSLKALPDLIKLHLSKLQQYAMAAYIVFIVSLFGVVFFKVSSLSNAEPSTDQVNSQVKAANIPHIDKDIVEQLQSLQDNSVSVQTLFNKPRSNPF